MQLLQTLRELQTFLAQRSQGQSLGLVPTMGALHAGHVRLLERAIAETDLTLVSIFVNPWQFGPQEDWAQYPRTLEQDCERARQVGIDAVFAPQAATLGIAPGETTLIEPPPSLTKVLCGAHRPGHFAGVATIVAKFFNLIQPQFAYFGEKDAQQLAVIRRLVADLSFPVAIRACPTVREQSGLALSSRNQYLNEAEQKLAASLYQGLRSAQSQFQQGVRDSLSLLGSVEQVLQAVPALKVQYLELVDPQSLQPLTTVVNEGLLAVAAYLGNTRLIDNVFLGSHLPLVVLDGPAGAGKSTVTRLVADRLGLTYLDTGALYRAIAYGVLKAGIGPEDEAAVAQNVAQSEIALIFRPAPQLTGAQLNGEDISDIIRSPQVTRLVSAIAAQKAVRAKLLGLQRFYGQGGGLVAEGRDLGTAVFPNAELKIFLTASVEERARRRYQDFIAQGKTDLSLEQLIVEINQRDQLDSTRSLAPLTKAYDAIEINTDGLTIEAVVERIVKLYQFLLREPC